MASSIHALPKTMHRPIRASKPPKKKISWKLGVSIIGLLFVLWLFFVSNTFDVATVTLSGTDAASARVYSETLKGQNIFLLNTLTVEAALRKAYPPIGSVTIVRGLPSTIKLDVTLRQPQLRWRVKDTVSILDSTGEVFDQGNKTEYAVLPEVSDLSGIQVSLGQPVVSPSFIEFIKTITKESPNHLKKNVTRFEVAETTLLVDAVLEGDIRVRLALNRPIEEQLKGASAIMAAHGDAKTIDVRVPGWGYWKT